MANGYERRGKRCPKCSWNPVSMVQSPRNPRSRGVTEIPLTQGVLIETPKL